MPVFTPTHLGKWETLYSDLLDGETLPLTADGTWMLADRPGLIAAFDDGEVVSLISQINLNHDSEERRQ